MKKIRVLSGFLALLIIIAGLRFGCMACVSFLYPLRYEEEIRQSAEDYQLDPYLVMAMVKTESNFNLRAHSGVARGLMQLTDSTAQWIAEKMGIEFQPEDVETPALNIQMGCYYLRYLLDYYNNEDLALAAYNAGMGNVTSWLSDERYSKNQKELSKIPFAETENYVKKIERFYRVYSYLYSK